MAPAHGVQDLAGKPPARRGSAWFRSQLRYKIAAAAAGLVVGLGLVVGALGYSKVHSLIVEREARYVKTQAMLAAQQVSGRLNSIATTLAALASNPVISSGIIDAPSQSPHVVPFLQSFSSIRGVPLQITLVDYKGRGIVEVGEPKLRSLPMDKVAAALKRRDASAWIPDHGAQEAVVTVLPLFYERTGAIEGGLVYTFAVDDLLVGADEENVLAALPAHFAVFLDHPHDESGPIHPRAETDIYLQESIALEAAAPIGQLGLVLTAAAPKAITTESLRELTLPAFWIAGFCIVVAASLAYYAASVVTRPLRKLDAAIGEVIRAGRLDVSVEAHGHDETARLCDSFNRMLDRLRHDIAQREVAEHALVQSQTRYKAIFEGAADAIFLSDSEMRIRDVNEMAIGSLGYSRQELLDMTVPQIEVGIDPEEVRERCRNPVEVPSIIVGMHRRKDGTEFPVEIRVSHFTLDGERTIISIVRNVAERHETLAALRRSEHRFRTIIDHSAMGVLVHQYGTPIYANETLAKMFGYDSPEEVLALSDILPLYQPDERPRIQHNMEARARGEEVPNSYERRGLRKDGQEVIVEGRVALVPWDDASAFCLSLIDITERRRTQEALHQAQKMEMLGQLTGGVAHDFNNLLTVIIGNLEMIGDRTEEIADAKLSRWANTARRAARRGSDLTQRLLAFSRRQVLEPSIVDPNQLVSGVQDMLQRSLGEDIELSIKLADGLSRVHVDAAQFESAVLNLAVNARDAMPDGGKLVIETAHREVDKAYTSSEEDLPPGRYVTVTVTDTGDGMSPETKQRVFEPFFTTKETGKGTGLGLSMVYGFVKQSKGHVTIYSEPGQGTTVRLYFPGLAGEVNLRESVECANEENGAHGTILVVEDDEEVRQTAVDMLENLGYRVLTAENGPSGLDVLKNHDDVELLFTDIVMPGGMTGIELARLAQYKYPRLKVLYTSGYAENALRKSGGASPNHIWIAKPYTTHHLAEKLREALNGGNLDDA